MVLLGFQWAKSFLYILFKFDQLKISFQHMYQPDITTTQIDI